jgi:hypothetical protein
VPLPGLGIVGAQAQSLNPARSPRHVELTQLALPSHTRLTTDEPSYSTHSSDPVSGAFSREMWAFHAPNSKSNVCCCAGVESDCAAAAGRRRATTSAHDMNDPFTTSSLRERPASRATAFGTGRFRTRNPLARKVCPTHPPTHIITFRVTQRGA